MPANAGAAEKLPTAATLTERIAALPTLATRDLQQAWAVAWGAPPPKGARRRFLALGIAWRWQATLIGGPSRNLARRLAGLEAAARAGQRLDPEQPAGARQLPPGTRLIRDWRGERHEVHVVEGGFLWRGRTRKSLSAIASEIAGGRRNGPAFFGLRRAAGR